MEKERQVAVKDHYLGPGYVALPGEPTRLCTVISSGAVVAVFDTRRKKGGMSHYVYPLRGKDGPSTAKYAAPAIVALVRMFLDAGSCVTDMEAHLLGGAVNRDAERFVDGMSEDNIRIGLEVLQKLGITKVSMDTGGNRGRKVVFHSGTGELMVVKVDEIRSSDWYPQ